MARKRDLVIIGGGAAGLVVASVASQLGLDVVLINKQEAMGGDCLHYGCVPSKTLLKTASVAYEMAHAEDWGLVPVKPRVDIKAVNRVIANAIDNLQVHDSRERFEALGCEVIAGEAHFSSPAEVEVNGEILEGKHFVIATGSSAFVPPVKGLDQVNYLTNEDIFSLPVLPARLIVLGGGPVGVEMAQAYSRLGSKVSIVEQAARLLPQMDMDSSGILADELSAEGISVYLNSEAAEVYQQDSIKHIILKDGVELQAEALLVAAGRKPVVASLGLENANIRYDARGIKVDGRMRTTNRRVYACGDVTGEMPLTHVAEQQAGIVITNMIFKLPKKVDYGVVPFVVYTQPEVAQVGLTVEQCNALRYGEIFQFEVSQLDRAVTDSNTAGMAKILTDKGRIVGAHIIAPHAGELIHELALAVQEKMKISKITSLVHAYPSYSQLNKRLAGQYYKNRLFSPLTKRIVALLNRISF